LPAFQISGSENKINRDSSSPVFDRTADHCLFYVALQVKGGLVATIKMIRRLAALTALSGLASAWLPEVNKKITATNGKNLFTSSNGKIRGVNLGSQFVFEPWIAETAWSDMGCGGQKSEFDCVSSLGQAKANSAFASHWSSWITQDDIAEMVSYGLNTIRVPVGYWMREDLVYSDSEHFPQGGLQYLENLCGWASDAGLYIIIDLHGAPGAQTPQNPFTGQYAPTAGFYQDYQFERALKFLEWMTTNIHQNDKFRNVGMLEVVNEPVQNAGQVGSMRTSYYPNAFKVGSLIHAQGQCSLLDRRESALQSKASTLIKTITCTSR
jgi:hypothetical protein